MDLSVCKVNKKAKQRKKTKIRVMQSTHSILFRFPLRGSMHNAVQPGPHAMPLKSGVADTCALDRQSFLRTNCAVHDKATYGTKDASEVARRRRVANVGRGSVLPSVLSFCSVQSQDRDAALRRVRAGGAVVPPKVIASPHVRPTQYGGSPNMPVLVRSRQGRRLLAVHPDKHTKWI